MKLWKTSSESGKSAEKTDFDIEKLKWKNLPEIYFFCNILHVHIPTLTLPFEMQIFSPNLQIHAFISSALNV